MTLLAVLIVVVGGAVAWSLIRRRQRQVDVLSERERNRRRFDRSDRP